MAGTLFLRPSSVYPYSRGGWDYFGSGATSLVNAVNEAVANDATYIRLTVPYNIPNYGSSLKFRTTPQQLPGGAKARYMVAKARANTTNYNTESLIRLLVQDVSGGNGDGVNWVEYGPNLGLNGPFKVITNSIAKSTVTDGKVINGGVITQNVINNLVVEVYNVETSAVQVSQLWIEVAYDEKPVINLNELNTVQNTTSPVLSWTYTDDLEPQASFDVEIRNNVGTLVHKNYNVSSAQSTYRVLASLPNGTYKARVRATQNWIYTGAAPVSDWDEITFTVAIGAPSTPTIAVVEEPTLGRVSINVTHNLNLLSQDVAEGEVVAWDKATNAKMLSSVVFDTGDRSVIAELTGGANAVINTVPLVPVTAGKFYGFAARVKAYTGDPLANVQAGINWYNSAGTFLSASTGAATVEIVSTWVRPTIRATAPVGAAFARPFVNILSTSAGAWHYIDSATLVALNALTDTIPAWSRGGFAFSSQNLLSYGDSSFEAVTHWNPIEDTTNASVINTTAEFADPTLMYQGNYALKISSVNALANRDNETFVTNSATSLVANRGDVLVGDFLLAFVEINSTTPTITAPSGWATVQTQDVGTTLRTAVYSKVATNAEPTTYTWTLSAAAKGAVEIKSVDGVNAVFASAKSTSAVSATVYAMPASTTTHNGILVEAVLGIRAASTVGTTWTSNLGTGTNTDAQLSTTANTAAEIAMGVFSQKQNTGLTTTTAVSGKTLTSSAALTSAVLYTIVLQATRTTARATLANYEYYEYDSTKPYQAYSAVLGAAFTALNSANRQVSLIVDTYDNNKVFIAGYYVAQTNASVGTWKAVTGTLAALNDPNKVFTTIRLEVDQPTDGEAYYFDAISFYQGAVNLGYVEGFKVIDGPNSEIEYSEDNGVTWKTSKDTSSYWMKQTVSDATSPQVVFHDYEIASGLERLYRVYNWKTEDGNLLQSGYSNIDSGEIDLYRIWMHLVTDPEGTVYHFLYDGTGRDDYFDKQADTLQFAGREYGQVHFGETSARTIDANLQLPSKESILALKKLNDTKALVIFRDQRGRRVKGLLDVKFSDVRWGATASFTVTVLGLQP